MRTHPTPSYHCSSWLAVAAEYFCNLDANLLRLDHLQRPELNKGTIDFAVPEAYWAQHPPPRITPLYQSVLPSEDTGYRTPEPMNYVFAIDVSVEAIQSGFTLAACRSLLTVLYGTYSIGHKPCIPPHTKIAIVTYDRTLHFYNLSVRLCTLKVMSTWLICFRASVPSRTSRNACGAGRRRCIRASTRRAVRRS